MFIKFYCCGKKNFCLPAWVNNLKSTWNKFHIYFLVKNHFKRQIKVYFDQRDGNPLYVFHEKLLFLRIRVISGALIQNLSYTLKISNQFNVTTVTVQITVDTWGVLVLLNFSHFSPECKETWSLGDTESLNGQFQC